MHDNLFTFVQYMCQTYGDVSEKVHSSMGDVVYQQFMVLLLLHYIV